MSGTGIMPSSEVKKQVRLRKGEEAVQVRKEELRETLAELAHDDKFAELMDSRSVFCPNAEPIISERDHVLSELASLLECDRVHRVGVPSGYHIEVVPEEMLETEPRGGYSLETVLAEASSDRLAARWVRQDRQERRSMQALKASMSRTERRRIMRQVHKLGREISRLEHLQICAGCQVGSLGLHYRAMWNRIFGQLIELRSRAVNPLLDRLEAIEPVTT